MVPSHVSTWKAVASRIVISGSAVVIADLQSIMDTKFAGEIFKSI